MFAYGGFRSAMVYAGESRTKNEAGRAVLLAFVISMAMYAIIPAVFIASLSPGILSHGWSGLATMKAPLAQSAVIAGVPALGALFILDGIISPSGASLIGAGDVSRYAYSLAKIRALPKVAGKVSEKRGIPILPTILALVASVGMLFFSPTFSESVKYLVAAHVLAYASGPASLFVLSELKSNKLLSVIAFALTALLYTWVGFPATLLGVAVTGFSILAMGLFNRPVKPAIWYLGFSLTMAGISLLSIDVEIPLALITSVLFLYIAKRTAAGQDELEI
ncbi:hypothetical protein [Metallosphaera hakonensis]|nr:hypothetical protein [Metallosphaera hakonensis]